MLHQQGLPEIFESATGRQESLRRVIELPAAEQGRGGGMRWERSGLEETGMSADTGDVVV